MKKKKQNKMMIGQAALIVTCVIVASFFVAGNLVLAGQYDFTSKYGKNYRMQKQSQINNSGCWWR